MATTFTVTTTADNGNNVTPTAGSLRAAIVAANLDNTATSGSPHQINFQAGLSGTITLAGTLPALNKHISINGPGAGVLAVSGANTYRIFIANAPFTIAIKGLTIENGFVTSGASGGGIASNAQLTVTDCYFDHNHAAFDGGAIHTYDGTGATATIQRCTFTDNSVEPGGNGAAVCNGTFTTNFTNSVTMTLTNCTFVGNHAVGSGAWGGALANSGTTMTVINCTITDNDADDGGGVITYRGTITLQNTVVANNTAATQGPDIDNGQAQGTITSNGHNLIGNNSGGVSGSFTNGTNGDIVGIDPELGPLQNNGGPTMTSAPLSFSPVIDAGSAVGGLTTDQRGTNYPRVEDLNAFANATGGNGSDIGAVEVRRFIVNITGDGADATTVGDGLADTDLGTGGDQTSLRSAIQESNAYADLNVIEFAIPTVGTVKTIMPGSSGLPVVSRSVYIDGWSQGGSGYSGTPKIEIDGTNATSGTFGLNIQAAQSTVRGLSIDNFPQIPVTGGNGIGIGIFGATTTDVWVYGCHIGVDPAGTTDRGNRQGGIWIGATANGNLIGTNGDGTDDAAERNIISGNDAFGVLIQSDDNVMAGNYVGPAIGGTTAFSNVTGIAIQNGVSGNRIGTNADGTSDAIERNVISGNTNGIVIQHSSTTGNVVAGNYIGTNVAGTGDLGNGNNGVLIQSSASGNTVGGTAAAAQNVISGNNASGIALTGSGTTANTIEGNYIGLNASGSASLGNSGPGISLTAGAHDNMIGGTASGARNIISGNGSAGLYISGSSSSGNVVQGNYIGTDPAGSASRANNGYGIQIDAAQNTTIGGGATGARNLISGNISGGVYLQNAVSGSVIAGNYIGTNAAGTADLGNGYSGVYMGVSVHNSRIGTNADGVNDAEERNVISGNVNDGITMGFYGSASPYDNVIAGNYIGTNATGTAAIPNDDSGIYLDGTGNRVGTNSDGVNDAAERNLLSGNTQTGISFVTALATTSSNIVAGNYIGTQADGASPLGNGIAGIRLFDGATANNVFGGSVDVAGNVVAFNGGGPQNTAKAGILVPNAGVGNSFLRNSVFSNVGPGIDLGGNGVTANDAGDPDSGPNNLQNFPVMTDVKLLGTGNLNVTYNVPSSSTNSAYPIRIEFFKSDGSGEGKTYLATHSYTTPATTASVTFTPAASMGVGDKLVATATDANGNTSEFSAEATVTPTITDQPDDLTVCAPDQAQFSVSATGTGLAYQWRKNGLDLSDGGNISGSNSATLTINPTSPLDNGSYDVIVSGTQSDPATLTVNTAPVVTDDPDNNAPPACPGSDVSFTATASGTPAPTVQWQVSTDNGGSWNDLSGETSTTLTLSGVTLAMDGYRYHAVFTNDCSTATTAAATLDVDNPPTFTAPADITIQCDESTDPSNTGVPTAVADDYGTPTIGYSDASTPGSCGNERTITRTWTATDACGNSTSHDQTITVEDTEAPTITLSSTAIEFWPPNHAYHTVNVSDFVTGVSDNCSSLSVSSIVITSVTSDEPEDANGNGDGNTLNDMVIANGCHSVQLREERNGNGNGRVYRIHVAISDGCGNTATASFPVSVRKSQGGAAAIEDAAAYTVNGICATPKMTPHDQPQPGNGISLMQNYPNPFNPTTEIEYSISTSGPVRLTVVDATGRTVATLVDEEQNAGEHSISFNCGELPSGTYYYVLESDGQRLDKSMILTK
jgi:titin